MVHRGVTEAYARLLVHVEVHIVDAAVLEQVSRPRAALAIHERTAVRAEPHRDALFGQDRAHAILHELVRHVQVLGRVAAGHVAQVLDADLLALGVLAARIVHEAHVILKVGGAHVLLPELDGRDFAVAVEHALGVGPLPVEALRRLAQVNRQDAVAGGDGLGDLVVDRRRVGVHVCHGSVQQVAQLRVHSARVLRGFGLREQVLRHGTVLLVHVQRHRPLASVTHHVGEQVLDQARVGRLSGTNQRGDILQEVVDALQLVEVHRVVLGELELLDAEVLLGDETGHIQRAEQPAATGTVLMGDLAVVDGDGEAALQQTGTVIVQRDLVDTGGGDGIHGQTVGLAGIE